MTEPIVEEMKKFNDTNGLVPPNNPKLDLNYAIDIYQ